MHIPKWLKRTVKWFFGTILSVVLLISGALYFFRDDIINYAVGEINKNLKARIEVAQIDITFWKTFPNVSLDFHKVFIRDALPDATRRDTLLYSDMIRMKFNPIDIWNEEYKVKAVEIGEGTLQLKVNEKGKVNYDIVKKGESKRTSGFELTLKSIRASDLRFSYTNQLHEQHYATDFRQLKLKGTFTDRKFSVHTEASMQIRRLQNGKIPIVVNQPATTSVAIFVNRDKNTVSLPNGVLHLAGLPLQIKVFVDSESVNASLVARELSLTDVANKLSVRETEHINRFKGSGTASISLKVHSGLKADAFPYIHCTFGVKNGRLVEPMKQLAVSNLQVAGTYSTLKGKGKEEVNLDRIAFHTTGRPFRGKLNIRRFSAPRYTGDAHGSVDLSVLHALFRLPKIDQLSGNVDLDTDFKLTTVNDQNGAAYVELEDGSGTAVMKGVSIKLLQDSRRFEQVSGKVIMNQHEAALENLRVSLGRSDLTLNGHFNQIDRFLQNKANLEVMVVAQSKKIDLADFNNAESAGSGVALRDWLLPDMIRGNARLDVGTITLGAHDFKDIHGNMVVDNRAILIEQLYGRNAEASVSGTLAVIETAPEYFDVTTSLVSGDLKFKPLFKEWNNFEQSVITSDNISGRAEVQLKLRAPFDMREGILKHKLVSEIKMKVYNGNLKNVQTFKELVASLKTPKTRLVLKKREIEALEGKLDNISFETLENTIYIANSTITIPEMLISSSALDIKTEGTHTFDNQIDYRFSFRLRELKMQRDETEFGIVEDDGTGIRLYVRMFGPLDNPTIVWDGQSKKEQAKENREEAKKEAMSILKSEFGLFKKDSTVHMYQPAVRQREEIRIQFDDAEETTPAQEDKETRERKNKLKEKINKLKQNQQKEQEDEFIIN